MRIGLVADAESPHTRPWVEAFGRAAQDVFLFSTRRGVVSPDVGCEVTAPLAAVEPPPGIGPDSAATTRPRPTRASTEPPGWELRRITRALRLVPAYRAWLRRVRPDSVLALRLQPEGYLASFGSVHPLILMSWGQDVLHYALGHPVHGLFARRAARNGDLFLGETEPVLAGWRSLGVPRDRLLLGFTGIDLSFWRPPTAEERSQARARLALAHPPWAESVHRGAPTLLSPRSAARRGHQENLLRAFAHCAPPEALLLQVGGGDPETRGRCLELAGSLRLGPRYLDAGTVPREILREFAWATDAMVSLWSPDGLSQSLLEGMAAGLFPIASDLPGNREWIVSGENGILVDPQDEVVLGGALRVALTDEELRTRVKALNGPRVATRADRTRNMERLTEIILHLEAPRRGTWIRPPA